MTESPQRPISELENVLRVIFGMQNEAYYARGLAADRWLERINEVFFHPTDLSAYQEDAADLPQGMLDLIARHNKAD